MPTTTPDPRTPQAPAGRFTPAYATALLTTWHRHIVAEAQSATGTHTSAHMLGLCRAAETLGLVDDEDAIRAATTTAVAVTTAVLGPRPTWLTASSLAWDRTATDHLLESLNALPPTPDAATTPPLAVAEPLPGLTAVGWVGHLPLGVDADGQAWLTLPSGRTPVRDLASAADAIDLAMAVTRTDAP